MVGWSPKTLTNKLSNFIVIKELPTILGRYSSNKIRKIQNVHQIIILKIWWVCSHEFKSQFLFFWCLYHLLFYLETIGISSTIIWWLIFEKQPFQFLVGNLNSGHSYLITTVCWRIKQLKHVLDNIPNLDYLSW